MKEKDQSIETLRGIAILLVVAGYIIEYDFAQVHDTVASLLRFSYHCLRPLRMPLFTVISAYLYAASPATSASFAKLIKGKMRRILIPFAVISTIQYITFALIPSQSASPALSKFYEVYLYPYQQFWFLYSIFQVFIIVGLMDCMNALATRGRWMFWTGLTLGSYVLFEPTRLFSLQGTNFLLPFFLLGYGMRRYGEWMFSKKKLIIYGWLGAMASAVWVMCYFKTGLSTTEYRLLAVFVSCTAVPLLFQARRSVPFLAQIGYFAFGIHLFNRIAILIVQKYVWHFHVQGTLLKFTAYLTFGVLLAIAINWAFERNSITRRFVLGMKDPGRATLTLIPSRRLAERQRSDVFGAE